MCFFICTMNRLPSTGRLRSTTLSPARDAIRFQPHNFQKFCKCYLTVRITFNSFCIYSFGNSDNQHGTTWGSHHSQSRTRHKFIVWNSCSFIYFPDMSPTEAPGRDAYRSDNILPQTAFKLSPSSYNTGFDLSSTPSNV